MMLVSLGVICFFPALNHSPNTTNPKAIKLLAQVDSIQTMNQNMNN